MVNWPYVPYIRDTGHMSKLKSLATAAAALVAVAAALWPTTSSTVASTNHVEGITVQGLDLHDGTVQKWGDTYYLYGTMYGCGFNWGQSSPWCGFGVSTATSLAGPWSQPTQLFPATGVSPFRNQTWQQLCGSSGFGCFNPRMIQRTGFGLDDGAYVLWFNAPADYHQTYANAYYSMTCAGPLGGCGNGNGGVTIKPSLWICANDGDFSIVIDGGQAYIVCTNANLTFAIERLNAQGTAGVNVGASSLAGLVKVEAPGIYRDGSTFILTYSDPNCGYCAGNGTSYATASNITGPYTAPANTGFSPDVQGRRAISATSCGGQPRTVFTVDEQPYQWIDLWAPTGGNQTTAGILFMPLIYTPAASSPGGVLPLQFAQWPCA